jgi:hypothetical protein
MGHYHEPRGYCGKLTLCPLYTVLAMHCTCYALYSLCTLLAMHCTRYALYYVGKPVVVLMH